MENVMTQKKKKVWPWVLASAAVLAAAGVLLYILWPRPLVTAQAYVAADLETAPVYNEEGAAAGEIVRGSTVIYVVEEENEERPGMIRLVTSSPEGEEIFEDEATFVWIESKHLTERVDQITRGEYDALIEQIMQKPITEMQELYNTRDIEK